MSVTINDVRKIQWGKTYLWEVLFDENNIEPRLPARFKKWTPATNVDEELASLESHQVDAYNTTLKFPEGTSVFALSITFADDEDNSIHNWLASWINNTILNGGRYVSTISECCKIVHVRKLNSRRQIIYTNSYLVYPEQGVHFVGDSESSLQSIPVNFVVVGRVDPAKGSTVTQSSKL